MVRFAEFMSDNEIEESLCATLGGDRGRPEVGRMLPLSDIYKLCKKPHHIVIT